ncbi:nucleotidyl transferase AbiEii/AbiGii toxin family protein [Risungbinella massiliensis]|uniref:nucleotidyl transferase AbiEii/AbiGii toxin family protein n=1 Tax=Risungbinella massiliensis TaxID=1329796 RepID=UPI0005CC2A47|nr:nucleotidyl transferase AbiEii/AbiGii toxin family protein [Risungbinella massiliensis]
MSDLIRRLETNYPLKELVALEALLRRASLVNMPFLLKGSLVTRQYFSDPTIRDAEDIDFLYLNKIHNVDQAYNTFTDWMIQITEMDLNDGIKFRSFRENSFWRYIDYAMAEDFPTVNTDIEYYFTDDEKGILNDELCLDVSFNLEMDGKPVPLEYRPVLGEKFSVPYTVPLSIQVAWKLHQTIVRPRFKDLYDLKHLLSHPSYDEHARKETLQNLVNECSMDQSITKEDIKKILVDDLRNLDSLLTNDYNLRKFAGNENKKDYFIQCVTDLRKTMNKVGINEHAFNHLPNPT